MHLNITGMASFYNKRQYQYTYAQWLVGSVSDAPRVDLPWHSPRYACAISAPTIKDRSFPQQQQLTSDHIFLFTNTTKFN